jgi:hypothetical protein
MTLGITTVSPIATKRISYESPCPNDGCPHPLNKVSFSSGVETRQTCDHFKDYELKRENGEHVMRFRFALV